MNTLGAIVSVGILAHGILRSYKVNGKHYLKLLHEIKTTLENDSRFCNEKVILQ